MDLSKYGPLQSILKFWTQLGPTQKVITSLFLAISVTLLVVVSVVASRPKMTVLFSGVQGEDAGAIITKLQEKKIPYEIDGSVIKVPDAQVAETRMDLASQGLPQGGTIGFELFDKGSSFGMTEFSQNLNYQRALQGELSRTIDGVEEVVQSRVHIAIPQQGAFDSDKKQPTASVLLKLRPGSQLSGDQVGGIVHLVSAAIPGMDPNHVTVVDTQGNTLSTPTDDATGMDPRMTSSQLSLKRSYEHEVETSVQSMLERVLGPNKAVVRVCAKINFDRVEKSSEVYEPLKTTGNNGVITSEEKTEENYGGAGPSGAPGTVGGIAGTTSNVRGGQAPAAAASGKAGYTRTESSTKYEVSKTTEHRMTAPGQVENMNIAVMVDGKVDAAKVASIQNVVSTAAGIDPKKGDKVTVESIAFDDTVAKTQDKELAAEASKTSYLSIGKTALGVILLVVFLLFLKGLMKKVNLTMPVPATAGVPLTEVAASPANMVQGYDSARTGAGGMPAPPQAAPEDVAAALRKWMSE